MELENQLQLLQDGSTRDSQGPSAGTSREQQLLTALRDQVMNGNGSQKDRQQSSALMEEIRSLELSNKQESREPLPNQEAGPLNSSQPAAGGSGRLTYEEFTALVGGAQGSSGNEQGTPIQRVRETLTSIAQPSSRNSTRRGTNLPAFIAALLTADTGDESSLEESDMPPTRGSTESRNDGDVVSQAERALSTARAQAAESQGIEIPNLPPLLAVAGVLGNEETLGSINADVMQLMQAVIGGGPDTPRDEARARSASGTLADGRQPQDRRDGRFQLSFPAGQNDVSGSVLNPQIPGAAGGSIPGFPGASGIFPFTGMGGSFGGPGFPAGMGMAFPGQAAGFPAGGMGGMAMAGGLGGLPSGGMGFPGLG